MDSSLLYASGTTRHLHSFPTRRSSDLVVVRLRVRKIDERREEVERHHGRRVAAGVGDRGAGVREIDRKSTRLNSSHVEISYAVFCLKKKNSKAGTVDCSMPRRRQRSQE